jgi:membrane-bound metal-dependent hydrolase YbcI (DUF457 family)
MPYPLGHTAIGLTTYELNGQKATPSQRFWVLMSVLLLSNLPDFDMLVGLVITGNAEAFHRGPSHSLFFAIAMGYAASKIAKRFWAVSPLSFRLCTGLIFSHVIADLVFTSAPASLFWPFEVHFNTGISSLGDVFHGIFFQSVKDIGIFLGCLGIIILIRGLKRTEIGKRVIKIRYLWQKWSML